MIIIAKSNEDTNKIQVDLRKKPEFIPDTPNRFPPEWNVIPIPPNSKIPKLLWKKYINEKYPRIRLQRHKGNYAVICGEISNNLVIIDLDLKNNDKRNYEDIKLEFEEKEPELSDTYQQETPHGYHYIYYLKDFCVDRSKNINIISKEISGKEIFSGITVTNFATKLSGVDILGNNGYALIAPSYLTELKIQDEHGNIIQDYEFKINNQKRKKKNPLKIQKVIKNDTLYYSLYNTTPIRTLNKKEWEKIHEFFFKKTPVIMRKGFVDILNGEIEVHEYAAKTGCKELLYWKYTFIEAWNYCGIEPAELFRFLELNQPNFEEKKAIENLSYPYHDFHNKPLTNKKYDELFPGYRTKKKEYDLKPTLSDEIPDKEDFYKLQYTKNDVIQRIKNFNGYDIEVTKYGIYKVKYVYQRDGNRYKVPTLMLDGKLLVDRIVYDKQMDDEELFIGTFNHREIHTKTIKEILLMVEGQTYHHGAGRDVIKRVLNYNAETLKLSKVKPKYILGFNNGWNLPQLELANKYSIIVYTDYQKIAYNAAKKMIGKYDEIETNEIKKTVRKFIARTQMNPIKFMINVGWSIAAAFRIPIIKHLNVFPLLFNFGDPNSGKSYIEDFWIIYMYGILKVHISPNVLESPSRLEDYISQMGLPISIQEIYECRKPEIVPIIKDHSTGISDFERKKSAREIDFKKPKVAAINFDCNVMPELFKTPALNSRSIFIHYNDEDKIVKDRVWIKMFKQLIKKKLFTFLYEYSKNWKDIDVYEKLDNVYDYFLENTTINITKIEKEYPRLLSIFQVILFGLAITEEIFGIDFNKLYQNKINDPEFDKEAGIFKLLLETRQTMPSDIRDQLFHFCHKAIIHTPELDGYKGPKYLTTRLDKYKKLKDRYLFTQDHLRDFNEYSKGKYNLKQLADLVRDAIQEKSHIEYKRLYMNNSRIYVMLIHEDFL